MAAIVQRLERLIVVQDVVGSNPTSRPIFLKNRVTRLFLNSRFRVLMADAKIVFFFVSAALFI